MSEHITTSSKIHFKPLEPDLDQIKIEDIAHALSLMTRANGHFPEFYSVAQHCIACCREAEARGLGDRLCLICLLHDASEAYIADITRPVKKELEEYLVIEERLQNAIYRRFLGELPTQEEMQEVTAIDDGLLYYEFLHYMGEELLDYVPVLQSHPKFCLQPFQEAEEEYLELYRRMGIH